MLYLVDDVKVFFFLYTNRKDALRDQSWFLHLVVLFKYFTELNIVGAHLSLFFFFSSASFYLLLLKFPFPFKRKRSVFPRVGLCESKKKKK